MAGVSVQARRSRVLAAQVAARVGVLTRPVGDDTGLNETLNNLLA
jgi:hypothetical protein